MTPQLTLPFPVATVPPADATAWRQAALDRTRDCVSRARAHWPAARIPDPVVTFNLRGLTAGEACIDTGAIRYNETLLLQYGQVFLDDIVPHEVAHLVVPVVWPGKPRPRSHGAEWKSVMGFFGAPARRCHAFEAEPARRVPRVAYRCRCARPHLLTVRAHRRIRRGTAEYSCRQCKDVLVRVKP